MKKSLTLITLLAGAAGAYAQGTMSFTGYTSKGPGFGMTVWSPQNDNSVLQGATSIDSPTGTVVIGAGVGQYNGVPLGGAGDSLSTEGIYGNGNLWTIAFFAAPGVNNTAGLATAEANNTPITTSLFEHQTGAYSLEIGVANASENGNDIAGVWLLQHAGGGSTGSTLPSAGPVGPFPASGGATIQMEVWYNAGGATFATSTIEGVSAIGNLTTLGTATSTSGAGAAPEGMGLGTMTDFTVEDVPEPATIALGVLGASAFLFRRRK